MSVGKNIALYRKQCGFTQEQLSEKIGVTAQAVSKWENETSNPDVMILPTIAKVLGIDMNTLFDKNEKQKNEMSFLELADVEYDVILSLYMQARRTFWGIKAPITEEDIKNRLQEFKEKHHSRNLRSISVCEGEEYHGAVMVSDAFSYVDRCYGTKESALLFDIQKAGDILSVLGNSDARRVLKEVYKGLITCGEGGMKMTTEELSEKCGLMPERVDEAANKLVHIRLLDMHEKIENGVYQKLYMGLYTSDFIYVLAILRIAYILAEDMNYDTMMYRAADGTMNYDGPGNA